MSKKKILYKIAPKVINFACRSLMYTVENRKGRTPFNSEELKMLRKALLTQNLFSINGTMIPEFEQEFAKCYDVPYAIASTSGTAAIHIALGALDLNPGDEVITAPITDMGTVAPILLQNAIPIFADIDETYNMDPTDVERKITSRTKAIMVVHLFGNPCDMDAMSSIAKRHNIPLIEDCAQAHMTKYKGKYVGTIGDIGCFSFQQSKHMTTGEGGMTMTSNKTYYERMKFFIDKGWARKGWGPRAYLFLAPNYRPSELVGAVGLAQLKKVEGVVKKRHELGEYMTSLLSNVDGIKPAPVTMGAQHSYWLYQVTIDKEVNIDLLAKEMIAEKVWVTAGYIGRPIYLCTEALTGKKTYGQSQCPFDCKDVTSTYNYEEGLCPNADEALKHLIGLPLDESWTKDDVKHAAESLIRIMSKFRKGAAQSTVQAQKIVASELSAVPIKEQVKTVRIGIVGCGQMGRWHLDSYKQNSQVKLVAFADAEVHRAKEFAKEVGAVAYGSHQEMIEHEKLDGVSICTVPSTHKNIALDFLNAGINVLCEKPLAISAAQAKEMVEKANEKGLLLLTAFKFRFFDEVKKTKELLENGTLGSIMNFRLMFGGYLDAAGSWYSRKEISGGGVIIDNASHAVDLIRYLFGEVNSVSAQVNTLQKIEVEDTAKLTVLLENGGFGTVDLGWNVSVPSKTYLEVYGVDGTALLDAEGVTYKFKTWNDWKRTVNKASLTEAFSRQITHFVDSIASKNPTFIKNIDGLKSQLIIEAAYRSAKEEKRIEIER